MLLALANPATNAQTDLEAARPSLGSAVLGCHIGSGEQAGLPG
jgi:hypothetical protein